MRERGFLLAGATALMFLAAPAASADQAARPPQPETPARTPLPPGPPAEKVPWERHIEIGGDVALVQRPASADAAGNASDVRYEGAVGFGLHARWEIFKYLRFAAYFIDAHHGIDLPPGALGQQGVLEIESLRTYSFGARLCPTLPIGTRARAWLSVGVGWGRMEFGRMTVKDATGAFQVRERSDPFVEFPMGIGGSFDIIPRWLSVELELTGAFVSSEDGDATGQKQAIDGQGRKTHIGGFPELDGTFVQTLGLSLVL